MCWAFERIAKLSPESLGAYIGQIMILKFMIRKGRVSGTTLKNGPKKGVIDCGVGILAMYSLVIVIIKGQEICYLKTHL